jgi:Flp pilus assembly pilin Flp
MRMRNCLESFMTDEKGSAAIEYGLIAAFLGIGIILSLSSVRDGFGNVTNSVTSGLGSR